MQNHWTRAMLECCPHTKPVLQPCAACVESMADKIAAIGKMEAIQQAKEVVSASAAASIRDQGELIAMTKERDKLHNRVVEQDRTIEWMRARMAEMKSHVNELEVSLHAEGVDKSLRKRA